MKDISVWEVGNPDYCIENHQCKGQKYVNYILLYINKLGIKFVSKNVLYITRYISWLVKVIHSFGYF